PAPEGADGLATSVGRRGRAAEGAFMLPLALLFVCADAPPRPGSRTIRAVWLADLDPDRVRPGPGHLVFAPGSRADAVTGHECVEATGADDMLRVVSFARGQTDEGLDIAAPIVVEGELVVIRHLARGQFRAVGFLALFGLALLGGRASSDKTITLWDTAYRPGPRIHKGHVKQVRGVAFAPGGRRLVSVGLDGRIKQWDVLTGQELPSFPGPGPGLLCLAISPDGRLLATGGDPGVVTVLDARTGRTLWAIKGHAGWLTHVAFSPDSRRLASGSHSRTLKLWDRARGQELRALRGHKDDVKGLVFSSNGTRLFSGSNDQTVKEWDPASGQELRTLKGHAEGVTDVALSPDGRWLASASHDGTVKLWDLASGQTLRTLIGHNDTVWSVVFHPNGTRLATAGWDQTVRVWDTATGHELANRKGHADRVLGVAFSPDGGFLASAGGTDLTVRVWDGRPVR